MKNIVQTITKAATTVGGFIKRNLATLAVGGILTISAGSALAVDDALTTAITSAMTVAKTNATSVLVGVVAILALFILFRLIKGASKKISAAITVGGIWLGSQASSFAVDDALTTAITDAMDLAKTNATSVLVGVVSILALFILFRLIKGASKKVSA